MTYQYSEDFDIDVDISPLLGTMAGPTCVDSRWYELALPREGRSPALQRKLDNSFRNAILLAQWGAIPKRTRDRRRAVRVPILTRVRTDNGPNMTACDISLSGLRCTGRPLSGSATVELNLPGEPFPVVARVELVHYAARAVTPLVGYRFVSIDLPYVRQISRYVERRVQRSLAA